MENGCWNWKKSLGSHHRGSIMINNKSYLAYRYSYLIHKGEIPDGMDVCHSCDNGACVNPDHLWLGTHKDNMQDMFKKNRRQAQVGSECHKAKLTEEQVVEIRLKYSTGYFTQKDLSAIYGVTHQSIQAIIKRKSWRHI